MLTSSKLQKFAKVNIELKLVAIEAMEGEECYIKKFTMGDTLAFRGKNESETIMSMIQLGVVDAKGEPLFPTTEDVAGMPVDVVTELLEHVSLHQGSPDVESQAKKS